MRQVRLREFKLPAESHLYDKGLKNNSWFLWASWWNLVWSWKCHKTWSILLWTEIEQPKCSQPFLRNFIAIPFSLQIWAQAHGAKDKHVPGKVPVDTGSSSYKSPIRDLLIHRVSAPSRKEVQLKANAMLCISADGNRLFYTNTSDSGLRENHSEHFK